jgi:hypothetical protein
VFTTLAPHLPDILAVEPDGTGHSRYQVALGNGSGTSFALGASNLQGWTVPTQVALGDLNGDGKADILAVEPDGTGHSRYQVGIAKGSGYEFTWSSTNLSNMTNPQFVALGNIQGD